MRFEGSFELEINFKTTLVIIRCQNCGVEYTIRFSPKTTEKAAVKTANKKTASGMANSRKIILNLALCKTEFLRTTGICGHCEY